MSAAEYPPPVRYQPKPGYQERNATINKSFNLGLVVQREVIARKLPTGKLHVVDFWSRRSLDADPDEIEQADKDSYIEAQNIAGDDFVYYHSDTPNADGEGRSWCLWLSRAAAQLAIKGEKHVAAMQRAPEFYSAIHVRASSLILVGSDVRLDPVYEMQYPKPQAS